VDEMAYLANCKLVKLQMDEVTCGLKGKLIKWQIDKVASG
jgi:hypothetical protein